MNWSLTLSRSRVPVVTRELYSSFLNSISERPKGPHISGAIAAGYQRQVQTSLALKSVCRQAGVEITKIPAAVIPQATWAEGLSSPLPTFVTVHPRRCVSFRSCSFHQPFYKPYTGRTSDISEVTEQVPLHGNYLYSPLFLITAIGLNVLGWAQLYIVSKIS